MQTKIQKWGNSLAVRIPKAFVREAHVAYGTPVDLSVDEPNQLAPLLNLLNLHRS